MNSDQKGRLAEGIAALYLTLKGYRILAKRYKTRVGEIDLIAKHKGHLVFIEVKKRKTLDDSLYSIHPGAQKRIRRTAEHFMIAKATLAQDLQPRFDVIAFAAYHQLKHIQNAF